MAIIKTAKNINTRVRYNYTVFTQKLEVNAEKIEVYSTVKDISLIGNKKIIMNGNK